MSTGNLLDAKGLWLCADRWTLHCRSVMPFPVGRRSVSLWWCFGPFVCGGIIALGLVPTARGESRSAEVRVQHLRCEFLTEPDAIETLTPRLSWRLASDRRGVEQTAWQVRVARTRAGLEEGRGALWDSGRRDRDDRLQVAYEGAPLESGAEYFWQVRIWDERGEPTPWSVPARWGMGLLQASDWGAEWIAAPDRTPWPTKPDPLVLPPARHFRRAFAIGKPVRRAVAYVSALGIYDLHCNGSRIGDAYFQPGWSDTSQRAYYRAHDITAQLRAGEENVVGAVVADGWYAGYVGYGLLVGYGPDRLGRWFYGKEPALRVQLQIEYEDGSRERVITDRSWRVTTSGPIQEADLIMGERHDARRELPGWDRAGYQANGWEPVVRADANPRFPARYRDAVEQRAVEVGFVPPPQMQAYGAPPIRVTEERPAQAIAEPSPGVYIFDLGQNIAGVVRLRVRGPAGTEIRLRYGERLHRDGRLMTENLRRARATDTYIVRGDPEGETWSPRFTYHGFQYVEVTGLVERPGLDAVTGLVLHNDTPLIGTFACSDAVLTRLAENARWTQRANFIEVPTDCPQRDERLGWMGDAGAYVGTATYYADVAGFLTKWMDDVVEAQRSFGAFPDYAPYPMAHGPGQQTFGSAWTDAGVMVPWTAWRTYGDLRMVERHWPALQRFMEWRHSTASPDGLGSRHGNPWGDWLNLDDPTPLELVDTCYAAKVADQMAEMAQALSRPVEAEVYQRRRARMEAAFVRQYRRSDGEYALPSQSSHVLALWAGLVPKEDTPRVVQALAARIARNDYRMSTGFLGTRSILSVLSEHGQHDLAVQLFQSRRFPSWGYAVANGANTVWERWDSYTEEHGFNGANGKQNAAMNSFSHYAFGAVMEWAFRELAGIGRSEPGSRVIPVRPRLPDPAGNPEAAPITWVAAESEVPAGRIATEWRRDGRSWTLQLDVPPNASARVRLDRAAAARVSESGQPLTHAAGVREVRASDGDLEVEVGSGRYLFAVVPPP